MTSHTRQLLSRSTTVLVEAMAFSPLSRRLSPGTMEPSALPPGFGVCSDLR